MLKEENEAPIPWCENHCDSCPRSMKYAELHKKYPDLEEGCRGGCEECIVKGESTDPQCLNYNLEAIQKSPEYHTPVPGKLPLLAIPLTNNTQYVYEERDVKNVTDCGFNVTSAVMGRGKNSAGKHWDLELLQALAGKIRIYLTNGCVGPGNISSEMKTHINNYVDWLFNWVYSVNEDGTEHHPFCGVTMADEPKMWQFRCCRHDSLLERYKLINQALETYNTDGMARINLVGIEEFGTVEKFQEYLDFYGKYFKPALWTYDCYPVMQHTPLLELSGFRQNYTAVRHGEYMQKHEAFYRNLEIVSATARKSGRPFWYYLLSTSHLCGNDGFYPVQLEQHMRYQAFSALAYGAQGIAYWRYLQAEDYRSETYFEAPINIDGTRNALWYYARRVNREIEKYTHVFLGSSLVKACHTETGRMMDLAENQGGTRVRYESSNPNETLWNLESLAEDSIPPIRSITTDTSSGLGVLVSHLKKLKTAQILTPNSAKAVLPSSVTYDHYVVIVSHDAVDYQDITISFKGMAVLDELTPIKSGGQAPAAKIDCALKPSVKRHLPPGAYIIFHWEE